MDRYKKLVGNSIIFGVGNFGSKFLLVLLVPLYTFHLSAAEFGTVDIITTTTTMLLPIISASIYESVLRFVMDDQESRNIVLSNAFVVTLIGIIFAIFMYPFLSYFKIANGYLIYIYIIFILESFQINMAQYSRAIGSVKVYAANGIIKTLTVGVSNIILLVVFRFGVEGYLFSIIISNCISIVFFALITDILKQISISEISISITKKMLKYSLPLIPNSFSWWIVNTSSRYFLLFYRGVEVNGLFAVSSKIPILLTMLTSIFGQAWQLSAIEEFKSGSKSRFYSKVFFYYQSILLICTSAILVILKPLILIAFANEFYLSWMYVPFLLLSVIFSSFSGFLGTNYIAAKETNGVFKSSVIGGFSNVILNATLIPTLGGIGAGVSATISFLIIWLIRACDTRRYIQINYNIKLLLISLSLIILQIIILFLNYNKWIEFILLLSIFLVLIILYLKFIKKLINVAKKIIINKLV